MNPAPATSKEPVLSVQDLSIAFPRSQGGGYVFAVEGISFEVGRAEIVALVGESGSGKSVTALSLLDLVPEPGRIASGRVVFEGRDVRALPEGEKRRVRGGGMGLVFQEPGAALDPVRTIGSELVAVLRRHRGLSRRDARSAAVDWLRRVALPEPERRLDDLPHRMSGGMRQRAMIALALAGGPRLLLADEPTTALDVTIQKQILELLRELRKDLGLAILLITHDLGVVAEIADRAIVMYAGRIVEEATVDELLKNPTHPYTRALLAARPSLAASPGRRLPAIEGKVPEPGHKPPGCSFAPRCPESLEPCVTRRPELLAVRGTSSRAACFLHEPAPTGNAAGSAP